MDSKLIQVFTEAKQCSHCEKSLPLGANPIFQLHPDAKILIIGQAPGTAAHETGIAFNDPSGIRLKEWLGISDKQFYTPELVAMMPMSFCYPGRGKSGDLPPIKVCAPLWHQKLLSAMPNIELTLLIGKYAQDAYLKMDKKMNLTDTVKNWQQFWPEFFPMPHPSPRNNIWLAKNRWYEKDVVPVLQKKVNSFFRNSKV
jgi:uracil-DNA glycosylase